jgi:group I intron endonuclease
METIQKPQAITTPVIYLITNNVNRKIYVGQAQNFYQRWVEHRKMRGRNRLYNSMKKHGWAAFSFSILEHLSDTAQLDSREQYWMDTLNSYEESLGYNICRIAGTTRGRKRPKSELVGLSLYREGCIGEKNHFFGRTHTQETKKKVSKANTGLKRSDEVKKAQAQRRSNFLIGPPAKPVHQIDINNGEIIKSYSCIRDAVKATGIKQSCISMVVNQTPYLMRGRQYTKNTAGGFKWIAA